MSNWVKLPFVDSKTPRPKWPLNPGQSGHRTPAKLAVLSIFKGSVLKRLYERGVPPRVGKTGKKYSRKSELGNEQRKPGSRACDACVARDRLFAPALQGDSQTHDRRERLSSGSARQHASHATPEAYSGHHDHQRPTTNEQQRDRLPQNCANAEPTKNKRVLWGTLPYYIERDLAEC